MNEVFGIDLGTTNSCLAVIDDNGLPLVMKNLDDEFTTPSVVYFDEVGDSLVGREGKNSMGKDARQTVAFIKREMSNPSYKREINGEVINPIKISSMILKKLKDDANTLREEEGKGKISKAVITVPAYFGSMERANTRQAAQLAGLDVLDLLNEPTAAALSYGSKDLEDKCFLMYDLGGGTFDVSIMRMKNGIMDTLATEGNHHLGGVDWDIAIVDHGLLQEGYDVAYEDICGEQESGKMMISAEICKKKLSDKDTEEATYKFLFRRKNHLVKIKRSTFEELTANLVQQTIDLVNEAVKMAKFKEPGLKLDEIILVGGSSYMPMIRKRIQKEFPSITIRLDRFEPDLAIAKGAAIYAAQKNGSRDIPVEIGQDLGTRSYGTSCRSSENERETVVTNLILKTDPMIVRKCGSFKTSDVQSRVKIDVYENLGLIGEIPMNKCVLMKQDWLSWGHDVPKGTPITMILDRGSDGVLKVYGECQGVTVQFAIEPKQALSESEAKEWKKELEMQTF